MTPTDRIRLAAALTEATGQRWRVAGRIEDPRVEGVCRDEGEPIGVWRAGPLGHIAWFGERHNFPRTVHTRSRPLPGIYTGRGWLPRLVADAVEAIREVDVEIRIATLSTREIRRADAYRRLLHPDSGASESERAQARGHLERMGVAP